MSGPLLSVVIPTYNRRDRLLLVLQGLAAQSMPGDQFEAVVIDDGSSDGTADWLTAQTFPFAVRVLRQKNSGPAAARNKGIEAASGKIILFIDDDVVPKPDLVREHARLHAEEPRIAVIGPLLSLPHYDQPWVAWEQRKLEAQYQSITRGEWKATFRQFWTGNASVPRDLLQEVGGFDVKLRRAEDVELAVRLALLGVQFRFNIAAAGVHHAERTLAAWSKMHRSYGLVEMTICKPLGVERGLNRLAHNWSVLRPVTRRLVVSCLGHPLTTAATIKTLSAAIETAGLLRMEKLAYLGCSALANVLYWTGAAEAIGLSALEAVFQRTLVQDYSA
jgi:glycosyltransferase involved in cell wall biosynthesis